MCKAYWKKYMAEWVYLSVSEQVSGSAGVEECSKNFPQGVLNLFLQGSAPLRRVALSAVVASVGHTFREVRQQLVHFI